MMGALFSRKATAEARLNPDVAVDASRTVFRIGSATKLFTAAAAVQLAEAGKLDLHRDVREYVPDIPLAYGATTHQLLTHTAGLDERFAGAYTDSPKHLQPLSEHLRRYIPEQVFRPGTASSYTNYGYALVGLVIERVSGIPYEEYIADRILRPLGMISSTAHQPPPSNLAGDLARGYRWVDGHHEPIPYNYTQARPGGGMTATAADIGRFMVAVLGDGSIEGGRMLTPKFLEMMLAEQYKPHALVPGTAYGFGHLLSHERRLLVSSGTLGDQSSLMVLFPEARLGIFIACNMVPGVGDFMFEPMMTHLAGPAAAPPPPVPLPNARQRAPRFAGSYRTYQQVRNEMTRLRSLMPMSQSRVSIEPDGAIRWQGRQWVEVEPLVFRSIDSMDYIVFRENERGEITGVGPYERISWLEQLPFHLAVLLSCVIAFLGYASSAAIRALRRQPSTPKGRAARRCAVLVAGLNLVFIVGLPIFIRDLGAITPLPLPIVLWLSLPMVSITVTALLPAFAASAWWRQWWTRGERLRYSIFVVLAVAFMTFLNYWRLLGFRY